MAWGQSVSDDQNHQWMPWTLLFRCISLISNSMHKIKSVRKSNCVFTAATCVRLKAKYMAAVIQSTTVMRRWCTASTCYWPIWHKHIAGRTVKVTGCAPLDLDTSCSCINKFHCKKICYLSVVLTVVWRWRPGCKCVCLTECHIPAIFSCLVICPHNTYILTCTLGCAVLLASKAIRHG